MKVTVFKGLKGGVVQDTYPDASILVDDHGVLRITGDAGIVALYSDGYWVSAHAGDMNVREN